MFFQGRGSVSGDFVTYVGGNVEIDNVSMFSIITLGRFYFGLSTDKVIQYSDIVTKAICKTLLDVKEQLDLTEYKKRFPVIRGNGLFSSSSSSISSSANWKRKEITNYDISIHQFEHTSNF